MKLHSAEVLDREAFGDHLLLRYRWTGTAPEPGQFVAARPAGGAASFLDPFLSRPFFVHDHSGEVVTLLIEVRGQATRRLAGGDDRVMVSAPRGQGFVAALHGPVALVGGGVWVSPLGLLSRRLAGSGVPHDVYLEVPDDAPDAYEALLSRSFPGATAVPTDGSPGRFLDRIGGLDRYTAVYASGPTPVLSAVKEASAGVVPAQLAVREVMACASGSCYGCAVPVWGDGGKGYARACVEGPIFAAETLAW